MISIDRTASSQSGTVTGTGAPQNIPHTLGVVPDLVLAQLDDTSTATIIMGAHTATNLVVTVTNNKTFKTIAFANANPAPN